MKDCSSAVTTVMVHHSNQTAGQRLIDTRVALETLILFHNTE